MQDSFYGWPASGQVGPGNGRCGQGSQSVSFPEHTNGSRHRQLANDGLISPRIIIVLAVRCLTCGGEMRRATTMSVDVVRCFYCVYVCRSGSFWAGITSDRRCGLPVLGDEDRGKVLARMQSSSF